jgi:hypothetical protein
MQVRYQLRHSPEFLGEEPTSRKQPVYLKPQFLPTRIGTRQAEKPWSGPRFWPEIRHEKIRRDQSIPADYPVELRGLEPLTPCMPCRCATSCATAPNFRCSGPSAHASVTGTLSGSLRSNSNILEHPFRKFQIGHIRGLSRRELLGATPFRKLPGPLPRHRHRAGGRRRGSPSRGAPGRRTRGLPRAGRG